jgi:hypothetical protein
MAIEAAVKPFPKEETTPPVTKIYFELIENIVTQKEVFLPSNFKPITTLGKQRRDF